MKLSLLELESRHNPSCTCPGCAMIPTEMIPYTSTYNGPELLDTGVPQMSSLPGANHTIYLDFDGHTTVGTWWNNNFNKPVITTPAFDVDGSPSTFSADERDRIRTIFFAVMEDFAPFNVNVTTVLPPLSDLIREDPNTDTRWGVQVAIGGNYQDWYPSPVGGVAFIGSFNYNGVSPAGSGYEMPCFVFADTLSDTPKFVWEVITHEVGHTLGLSHDGRISPAETYYLGHPGWAPIMGAGYYQELVQWSKGEYANANNLQDDLAIITGTNNGFGYRPDDYVAPIMMGVDVTRSGIIERGDDVDVFEFTANWSGDKPASKTVPTRILVVPNDISPNLNIRARLYDQFGTLLFDSNSVDTLAADFSVVLRAGRSYSVHVEGAGNLPIYSDYASLGQYKISVIRP